MTKKQELICSFALFSCVYTTETNGSQKASFVYVVWEYSLR